MEKFVYRQGVTTVDDVIEHVFMRINTDFLDTYLDVNGFCRIKEWESDSGMVRMVVNKMFEYGVAKKWGGRLATSSEIEVTAKGIELYRNGQGWKWILAAERAKAELIARQLAEKEAEERSLREREHSLKLREIDLQSKAVAEAKKTSVATWVASFIAFASVGWSYFKTDEANELRSEVTATKNALLAESKKSDSLSQVLLQFHSEKSTVDSTSTSSKMSQKSLDPP